MERLKPESERRSFSADRAEISVLERDPLSSMPEQLRKYPWPLELQGKGEARERDATFIVKYPKGDVLLSFTTLIHELGHPLQHARNAKLRLGARTHENLFAEEADAWERGWKRFGTADPATLKRLEETFQSHRGRGPLAKFSSFEDMYHWIRDHVLQMVEVQRVLFEQGKATDRKWSDLTEELDRVGIQKFLDAYSQLRISVQIDDRDARGAIRKTLRGIVSEKKG